MASSSAMTTRVVTGLLPSTEVRVSAIRRSSSSSWVCSSRLIWSSTSARWRCMASAWRWASLVLPVGERRLRHQRPQPGVVGGLGEVAELLVGHGELLAQLLEARADLGEAAFDQGPGHRRQCTRHGVSDRICDDAAMASLPARRSAPPGPGDRSSPWWRSLAGCGDDDPSGGLRADHPGGARPGVPRPRRRAPRPTSSTRPTRRPPAPTSPRPRCDGVVDEPITRPVQVGILERGDVLAAARPGPRRRRARAPRGPGRRRRGRRARTPTSPHRSSRRHGSTSGPATRSTPTRCRSSSTSGGARAPTE